MQRTRSAADQGARRERAHCPGQPRRCVRKVLCSQGRLSTHRIESRRTESALGRSLFALFRFSFGPSFDDALQRSAVRKLPERANNPTYSSSLINCVARRFCTSSIRLVLPSINREPVGLRRYARRIHHPYLVSSGGQRDRFCEQRAAIEACRYLYPVYNQSSIRINPISAHN